MKERFEQVENDNLLMDEQDVMDAFDDPFLGIHNPTVYSSRAEMKAIESESGLD